MEQANQERKQEEDKNEVLQWACARGLLPDAMELVANGADPSVADKQGRRPMHYAAAHGHADVLRYLSSHGADADADDAKGRTPVHYAALGGHTEAVKALVGKCWVDALDAEGNTPLHLAARGFGAPGSSPTSWKGLSSAEEELMPSEEGRSSRVDAFTSAQQQQNSGDVIRALVAAGAKLGGVNSQGLTPLGSALTSGNAVALAALLKSGADAGVMARGCSLLHLAAGLGQPQCLELLLEGSAALNEGSADTPAAKTALSHINTCLGGMSPLHAAAMAGSLPCASALLKHGADATATSSEGKTPAQMVSVPSSSISPQTAAAAAVARSKQHANGDKKDATAAALALQSLLRSAAAAVAPKESTAATESTAQQSSSNSGDSSATQAADTASLALNEKESNGPQSEKVGAAEKPGDEKESKAQQSPAQNKAGKGSPTKQSPAQDKSKDYKDDPSQEPLQSRFERMSELERLRKVDFYARMDDKDVASFPHMPPSVLPLIKNLKRAHQLLACWQPIVALRSDADLQNDLQDVMLRNKIEIMSKPDANIQKFMGDSQVRSVFTKFAKLQAVLRENGQGIKVMLADVRTTPHGPNSLYETRRKMTLLEERVATCQAEAIKHILEGGSWEEEDYGEESDEEDKGEQGGGEKKEGEAGAAGTEAGQSQQGEGQIEGKKEETGPGAALRKRLGCAVGLEEAKAGGTPAWNAVMGGMIKVCMWQMLRILGFMLIMMMAMSMVGLMPDQLRAKALQKQEMRVTTAAAARQSGADVLFEPGEPVRVDKECPSGTCNARKARKKTAYEQAYEGVQETKRRAAEAQRLEELGTEATEQAKQELLERLKREYREAQERKAKQVEL